MQYIIGDGVDDDEKLYTYLYLVLMLILVERARLNICILMDIFQRSRVISCMSIPDRRSIWRSFGSFQHLPEDRKR